MASIGGVRLPNETGEHICAEDWYPIQVKQKDKEGLPDIDAFEAVITREDRGALGLA